MSAEPNERVILYVRQECHLCDAARAAVAEVAEATGVGWAEVDVDESPQAAAVYGELVPVVTVDGVQQGYWRLDPRRIRRAVEAGRA
jgi:thiol-disulfide isomerase/thioredoxin